MSCWCILAQMIAFLRESILRLPTRQEFRQESRAIERRLSRQILSLRSKPTPHFDWSVGPVTSKPQSKQPMIIQITNEQQVKVTLSPKTDAGKPASLDGAPTWEVVSGNSTIVQSEDGLSATLVSGEEPGDTQVLVKADADLGEGYVEISEILELKVSGAAATNLGISVGTPELKPTTTPEG